MNDNALHDQFGRRFDYLRIAVTEHCNLRCIYCMPAQGLTFLQPDKQLAAAEIKRFIEVFAALGVTKIRFTGGEPLVRPDIAQLVALAKNTHGIRTVHLTTNGVLLTRHAQSLKDAGLDGLNISLDTLRADRFAQMTRRSHLQDVLHAIELASQLQFASIKINAVMLRGFNEDEIADFVDLTKSRAVTVRFIELMPFDSHQVWKTGKFFGAALIVQSLQQHFDQLTPDTGSSTEEHVFRLPGYRGKIAVIPAYTRSLCGSCNRIRLTADGKIRNCLYASDETDLRQLANNGATNEQLTDAIRQTMWHKPIDGWAAQKNAPEQRHSMTQIGG